MFMLDLFSTETCWNFPLWGNKTLCQNSSQIQHSPIPSSNTKFSIFSWPESLIPSSHFQFHTEPFFCRRNHCTFISIGKEVSKIHCWDIHLYDSVFLTSLKKSKLVLLNQRYQTAYNLYTFKWKQNFIFQHSIH
jgi:hypothetical protein